MDEAKGVNKKPMRLSKQKFIEDILIGKFKGNQAQCAAALGITAGYMSKFLNTQSAKGGLDLLGGIIQYCQENGLQPEDFISGYRLLK